MANVQIDQSLIKHFIDSAFGLPIAYENSEYDQIPGQPYAELIVLQNDTTMLNLKHTNETDGLFRIILRYPTDKGAIVAKTMAQNIFDAFVLGSRLTYGITTLTIVNHSRQQGVPEDGWYKLVLSIGYKALIRR